MLRKEVLKIGGTVPASNYVQFPKSSSQSLGLVGDNLYLVLKVAKGKPFVLHFDAATEGGLVLRVSISNLYPEFKETSTWLQFPYTEPSHKWTFLHIDFRSVLQTYTSRRFTYLKGIQLCGNMLIRSVYTSQEIYTDMAKLPRDMKLFVPKGKAWVDRYGTIPPAFI